MGRRPTRKRRGRVPELTGLQLGDGPGVSAERVGGHEILPVGGHEAAR